MNLVQITLESDSIFSGKFNPVKMITVSQRISYENIFFCIYSTSAKENTIKILLLKFNKELKTWPHENVIINIYFLSSSFINFSFQLIKKLTVQNAIKLLKYFWKFYQTCSDPLWSQSLYHIKRIDAQNFN